MSESAWERRAVGVEQPVRIRQVTISIAPGQNRARKDGSTLIPALCYGSHYSTHEIGCKIEMERGRAGRDRGFVREKHSVQGRQEAKTRRRVKASARCLLSKVGEISNLI